MEKLKTTRRNPSTSASTGTDAELRRAELLYQQNQSAEAAAVCAGVLEREPGNFDALRLLGNAQLQLDQPAEAVLTFDRALLQQPDFAELLYNRGNALQRLSCVLSIPWRGPISVWRFVICDACAKPLRAPITRCS